MILVCANIYVDSGVLDFVGTRPAPLLSGPPYQFSPSSLQGSLAGKRYNPLSSMSCT